MYRYLDKSKKTVVKLVSLEEARQIMGIVSVYSISASFFPNGAFYPKVTELTERPKGSATGKTIYAIWVYPLDKNNVEYLSVKDFPYFKSLQNKPVVKDITETCTYHRTPVHSGLEEFLSLMEELSKVPNESAAEVSKEQSKPDTTKNPTIKLDHEVLKSLYSLAKHLTYNDWLTLTQSLAV